MIGGAFLWGLVFYKIYTKIIHKLYVGLRFRLVCMECRELCHNRHMVSLLTGCRVALPKVSRTRKRYVQALHLSPGFGDFRRCGSRARESIIRFRIKNLNFKIAIFNMEILYIYLFRCLNTKISLEIFRCQKR